MKDILNKRFGKLIVINFDRKDGRGRCFWNCKCDCGKELITREYELLRGRTKSCGCNRIKNLEGKRFGKLIVLSLSHIDNRHASHWNCKCDCGKECVVKSGSLRYGSTKSCGCLPKTTGNKNPFFKGYEGISGTMFGNIKRRCIRGNNRKLNFNLSIEYLWDLYLKQNKKCALSGIDINFSTDSRSFDGNASLDRIDSNRGYEPDNVQWVHKDVNLMKQNLNESYFFRLCKEITTFRKLTSYKNTI